MRPKRNKLFIGRAVIGEKQYLCSLDEQEQQEDAQPGFHPLHGGDAGDGRKDGPQHCHRKCHPAVQDAGEDFEEING